MRASIILPTLTEALAAPLARLQASLAAIGGGDFEILVVDDSPDDVRDGVKAEVLGASTDTHVDMRFIAGPRTGKGGAVHRGIERARGDVIFIIDCDLPVPLEHIQEFLKLIEGGADVVIAERPARRYAGRPLRRVLSLGLLAVQRAVVFHSTRFGDTQCGFKAFRASLLHEVAAKQVVDGGMFDLEYLYVAARWGAEIVCVSVSINEEIRESKINVLKCLRRDPYDIIRFKARGLTRWYG